MSLSKILVWISVFQISLLPSAQAGGAFAFWKPVTVVVSGTTTTIYLTSGTSWTVPADWNSSSNTIECIGGGGGGGTGTTTGVGGSGGGGGGYSKITNLSISGTVTYNIGAAGSGAIVGGAVATAGGDTWFNGASFATASVAAKGGGAAVNSSGTTVGAAGAGGAAASGIGATKYSGGTGGSQLSTYRGGGGGGGSAGPLGNGANGGSPSFHNGAGGGGNGGGTAGVSDGLTSGQTGSAGGNNASGIGGGAAGGNAAVGQPGTSGGGGGGCGTAPPTGSVTGAGGPGIDWDSTHGSGGGGGGGAAGATNAVACAGGAGGSYGAGGGGGGTAGAGGSSTPAPGGAGAQGICRITYTTTVTTTTTTTTTTLPAASNGYFVLTAGVWNGALGGMTGADAKCLSDLQTYDWAGKSSATVDSTHVKAFICDGTSCNNLLANKTYKFAVSNDTGLGGASFTTNASGLGPNDSADWSGSTYFGAGDKFYWTGRDVGTATQWPNTPDTSANCSNWSTNATSNKGRRGYNTDVAAPRWNNLSPGCNATYGLVCIVNP